VPFSLRGHLEICKTWGEGLFRAPDLVLVTANAGSHPKSSQASLETLYSTPYYTEKTIDDGTLCSAPPTVERVDDRAPHNNMDELDPLPAIAATRIKRHTDVSQDPRYILHDPSASSYDAECTSAPSRIPPWVLSVEETQALFEGGHGTNPDLIHARGVPDTPNPGQTNFDKTTCTLILIEIGFFRDLRCDKNHAEKTERTPLVAAPKQYWGRLEFVAIPIGHAGTTLTRTLDHLTAAFSTIRPRMDRTNASKGMSQPNMYSNAKTHDFFYYY